MVRYHELFETYAVMAVSICPQVNLLGHVQVLFAFPCMAMVSIFIDAGFFNLHKVCQRVVGCEGRCEGRWFRYETQIPSKEWFLHKMWWPSRSRDDDFYV
jgi:hypothetical protein